MIGPEDQWLNEQPALVSPPLPPLATFHAYDAETVKLYANASGFASAVHEFNERLRGLEKHGAAGMHAETVTRIRHLWFAEMEGLLE
tara:strand:+ start:3207 stop:3467 length:261 start_codon:yes stop_codon:yes gene_type:complete